MNELDKIRELCKKHGTSIKSLESELGFSNGSLSKAKSIKADRLAAIAQYFDVPMEIFYEDDKTEQMPIEQARLIAHNVEQAKELEREKIKDAIDYYTDPKTAEIMQQLFESPGRRALFDAVADMDEESVQKYADFIERITHDNKTN